MFNHLAIYDPVGAIVNSTSSSLSLTLPEDYNSGIAKVRAELTVQESTTSPTGQDGVALDYSYTHNTVVDSGVVSCSCDEVSPM
jgi:hypothetical protein